MRLSKIRKNAKIIYEGEDLDIVTKQCTKCKLVKILRLFSKHNTAKYGRNSVCITCDSARVDVWQKTNKDKVKLRSKRFAEKSKTKLYRKNWHLENKYNISLQKYDVLVLKQDGKCAICKLDTKGLHVDHCHLTSKVRGLLCKRCNWAIGHFKDNIDSLKNAIEYLGGYFENN